MRQQTPWCWAQLPIPPARGPTNIEKEETESPVQQMLLPGSGQQSDRPHRSCWPSSPYRCQKGCGTYDHSHCLGWQLRSHMQKNALCVAAAAVVVACYCGCVAADLLHTPSGAVVSAQQRTACWCRHCSTSAPYALRRLSHAPIGLLSHYYSYSFAAI